MRNHWMSHFLAVPALSMVTLALLACGGETTPSDDAPARATTATSTPTPATATEVRDSSGTSLGEYLAICSSPSSGPIDVELTLEGFATVLGEYMERLESMEPPESVTAWHDAVLVYQKALQEALDDAPEFDDEDAETLYLVTAVFPAVLPHQPAIDAAIDAMDPEVYAHMVEAGCIDEEGFGFGGDTTGGGRVITEFASISAGDNHTCGVGTDGYVGCWGGYSPGNIQPPDGEFSSVSAGRSHTCGVRADGTVACWGGDDEEKTMPPGGEFISVSAGSKHTCGVRTDGSVACWGSNTSFGEFAGQATPPAGQFVSVSAGFDHTCGIRADASVACWGDGYDGQDTPPEGGFVSVSVSGGTCAVRTDGSVACWGDGYGGRLLGVSERPPEGTFISVSIGSTHSCGVRTDGSVACWGSDHQSVNPRRPRANLSPSAPESTTTAG